MSDSLNINRNGDRIRVSTPAGAALRDGKADSSTPLDALTVKQALNWLDTNVTDLASARTALKHLTRLIFTLRAERDRKESGPRPRRDRER